MEPTVQTDRTVSNNILGSIIGDSKQGKCMSIDVAIPSDRNVIKKEAEMGTRKARNLGITETSHIVHCT
jgi:hypothetical protein